MGSIRVLAFGGCMLRGPLARARNAAHAQTNPAWSEVSRDVIIAGPPFATYTFGEIFQALDVYGGKRYLPTEIRPLCGVGPNFSPNPLVLRRLDGVIVEPNTSNEIEFEGYYLNRAPFLRVLTQFKTWGVEARRLAVRLYNQGITAMDDEVRRSTAEKLIKLLPSDLPNRELTTALLRNARGSRRDIRSGFEQLMKMVDVPMGVVSYTWQYMPDGRPISWPAEFGKKVREAAAEFQLPICEPRVLVEQTGVEAALKPDFRHYREEFQPQVASLLTQFALDTVANGKKKQGALSREIQGSEAA
jgi:hypothetical protein